MSVPLIRAELTKLARTLHVEVEELEFLAGARPAELRALRENVALWLFEADRGPFERVAALAGKLPGAMAAQLAQHALGPRLSARAAALLDPEHARALAHRLPAHFLADIAVAADVARVAHLLAEIPPEQVAEITVELAQREEWVCMGAFVAHLPDATLDAALGVLHDAALLHAGFLIEDPARMPQIVDRLTDEQLRGIIAVASDTGAWVAAITVAGYAGAAGRKRLGAAVGALSADELELMAAQLRADPGLSAAARPLLASAPVRVRRVADAA